MTSKIEIQKGGADNSDYMQNWLPPEISSPLFKLQKFQKPDKSSAESYKTHWNLMKDQEFGSIKPLTLKSCRGEQIIKTFCKTGSP